MCILTADTLLSLDLQVELHSHLSLSLLEPHLLHLLDDVDAVRLVDVDLDFARHPPLGVPLLLDLELLKLLLCLNTLVHNDLAASARVRSVLHKLFEDQHWLQEAVLLEFQVHLRRLLWDLRRHCELRTARHIDPVALDFVEFGSVRQDLLKVLQCDRRLSFLVEISHCLLKVRRMQ